MCITVASSITGDQTIHPTLSDFDNFPLEFYISGPLNSRNPTLLLAMSVSIYLAPGGSFHRPFAPATASSRWVHFPLQYLGTRSVAVKEILFYMHGAHTSASYEADNKHYWKVTSGSHDFIRGDVARIGILHFIHWLSFAEPILSCPKGRSKGGWWQ